MTARYIEWIVEVSMEARSESWKAAPDILRRRISERNTYRCPVNLAARRAFNWT